MGKNPQKLLSNKLPLWVRSIIYSNMNKVEVILETQKKKEGWKHMMHPKFQTKKNKQK